MRPWVSSAIRSRVMSSKLAQRIDRWPKTSRASTLAGAPESAAAFDRAIADYYGLTGDPVGVLKPALARDPGFALGGVAIAALYMIGGFRGDHPEVVERARARPKRRSGAPRSASGAISPPPRPGRKARRRRRSPAGRRSSPIIPTDALALRLAQDAYFFLGRSVAIRDCAARVLPAWDRDNPLASFVLGLYAFGLEETGDLKRAEDFGREALARNPRDAWATHALAHVMETANRHEEGVAFLKSTRANWAPRAFHGRPQRLASGAVSDRAGPVRRGSRRLRPLHGARSSPTTRRSTASTPPRFCGGSNSRASTSAIAGRRSPTDGWRMSTTIVLAFNDLHCAFAAARSPDPERRRALPALARRL